MPDTPRAAKSREEDRAPYLLLVRARLAVLRQELQDLVDARLLRLPHGRRGRSGHGLAAPRPSRVSFDRSSRDGDGQTIGSRLVNGGTVRRRAPLAVTPGRLNRSPIRVSKTRRLARGTRQWRLGAGDGSGAQTATNVRRETPFLGTPRKKFAVHVRALVRSCPTAHAPRVPSRDARTMRRPRRSPSAYPRTCCGSSRCVSRSSAARPQASRDPEARFPFSRAAATSRRHARADRVRAPTRCPFANRAHLQSLTNALLSATLTRVPNTRAPAKPRRDTRRVHG